MEYSQKHIVAFQRWREVGSEGLTPAEIDAIANEDPEMGMSIRKTRLDGELAEAKRFQALSPPPAPAPARAAAPQLTAPRDGEDFDAWANRNKKAPMTLGLFMPIFKQITEFVMDMNGKNKERNVRIGAIEQRLDALEQRPTGVEYGGVFQEGKTYRPGVLVTRSGALWLSLRTAAATPGNDPDVWRLVVKQGKA